MDNNRLTDIKKYLTETIEYIKKHKIVSIAISLVLIIILSVLVKSLSYEPEIIIISPAFETLDIPPSSTLSWEGKNKEILYLEDILDAMNQVLPNVKKPFEPLRLKYSVYYRSEGVRDWQAFKHDDDWNDNNKKHSYSVGKNELKPGVKYDWKVEAENNRGKRNTSETWNFTTRSKPFIAFRIGQDGKKAGDNLQIDKGESIELEYNVTNVKNIKIYSSDGWNMSLSADENNNVVGTKENEPINDNTSYTLEADNSGWDVSKETIYVTFKSSKPTINEFKVVPEKIVRGETATLSWQVLGADRIIIRQLDFLRLYDGPQRFGSLGLGKPQTNTTYILEARNNLGLPNNESINLTVIIQKPRINFKPNKIPPNMTKGESIDLSWDVLDADNDDIILSSEINGQAILPSERVNRTGHEIVTPQSTRKYKLKAHNEAGPSEEAITVNVTNCPEAKIGPIEKDPKHAKIYIFNGSAIACKDSKIKSFAWYDNRELLGSPCVNPVLEYCNISAEIDKPGSHSIIFRVTDDKGAFDEAKATINFI